MADPLVPQGSIYFELRRLVLSTVVDGSKATFTHKNTVSDWLINGSYIVAGSGSSYYLLNVSIVDFASALLTDVEYLSNHCMEHLQEMICFHLDERPRSNSWQVVTTYYFAFFNVQALLRLLGMPVIYLKKDILAKIKLAGNLTLGPGAGAFTVDKVQDLSATHIQIKLKQSNSSRIHDATWNRAFSKFEEMLRDPKLNSNAPEVQFYSSLTTKALFSNYKDSRFAWPSEIRNRANYKPGYAYLLVQNDDITRAKKAMNGWTSLTEWPEVQRLLSGSVANCVGGDKSTFSSHVGLLNDVAQCLHLLTRELYGELLVRRGIDKRWEQNRIKFREKMSFPDQKFPLIGR